MQAAIQFVERASSNFSSYVPDVKVAVQTKWKNFTVQVISLKDEVRLNPKESAKKVAFVAALCVAISFKPFLIVATFVRVIDAIGTRMFKAEITSEEKLPLLTYSKYCLSVFAIKAFASITLFPVSPATFLVEVVGTVASYDLYNTASSLI